MDEENEITRDGWEQKLKIKWKILVPLTVIVLSIENNKYPIKEINMRKKIGKEVIVGSCRKREKFKGIKVEGTKKSSQFLYWSYVFYNPCCSLRYRIQNPDSYDNKPIKVRDSSSI